MAKKRAERTEVIRGKGGMKFVVTYPINVLPRSCGTGAPAGNAHTRPKAKHRREDLIKASGKKQVLKGRGPLGIVPCVDVPRGTSTDPSRERSPVSKVQKSRLGRGLSSLISVSSTPVEVELPGPHIPPVAPLNLGSEDVGQVPDAPPVAQNELQREPHPSPTGQPIELPVDTIQPNPHQPRKHIDEAKVAELAASLKSTGVIQPVVVRRQGDGYELIAGERRWRAARHAGLATIPAIVREVSAAEQAQIALVENIQREDLNPLERAESYRALIDQLGLTQVELANRLGEERSSVTNHLRLLELSDGVRQLVRDGQLSLGHAKILAGVADPVEQERLAGLVKTQDLSVRNLERLIADGPVSATEPTQSDSRPATPDLRSAHIQDLERTLARQLGMRVQVKTAARKGHGKLVLHYASLDQFDALLSRLGVTME